MGWTDERVERLKKLWADGLSASQIAGELGGITRNAVIGKVHRLGLSGRAKSSSSGTARPRKARAPGMMRVSRSSMRGNTALAHAYEHDLDPDGATPHHPGADGRYLPLADRRSRQPGILLLRR
jgi:GcrA cell cycle regulator